MPPNQNTNKRIEKLFTDIKNIVDQPVDNLLAVLDRNALQPQVPSETAEYQHEIEALQARVCELERSLAEAEGQRMKDSAQAPESGSRSEKEAASPAPLLYEKEKVGYVFSNDQLAPVELASTILTDSNHEISAPLMAGGQIIGEVQIHSSAEHSMTAEEENLASAVAQRASLQIQNLRLLDTAERARVEALEATRRFTHQSWESFLDGIRNSERIGYAYNQSAVEPFTEPLPAQHDHEETVHVLDEEIGRLFVKADPAKPLSAEDRAMISAVALQISQQVENIRLLADAARARADAEAATRRLTRENWQAVAEHHENKTLGFIYDSNTVSPIDVTTVIPADNAFDQPLTVQGESIGLLKVMGLPNISPEQRELAASIAVQTSIHLETLRLNEELQKRALELQELDRLKSAFLANMSHELRTPLNSILGFADVMLEGLDGTLTDYMDNDLRLIQKNGQHLLHLINDVLDMAKIESGRMNLHPEKFKMHNLLDEVVNIMSTLASEKNTALFIADDSDPNVEILADNTRIRQVIINLVNNAIKFTANGKIRLTTSLLDGARALITVEDTGLGIPADQLESIFEEFTQVDTSTTRKVGGTGLGLPISRRLVEMHGGRLWVESTGIPGEGSTFYVELPLEARLTEVVEKKER